MKKNVSDQESDAAIEEWPVRPYSKSGKLPKLAY